MSEEPLGDETPQQPELHLVPRDTSFEQNLDETAPQPEPVHGGEGFEIPALGGERRPIIPEHLQTWKGIKGTAYKHADAARFHVLFHLLRSPVYLVMGIIWAFVGAAKIAGEQRAWWWVSEQSFLRSKAVVDGNSPEWRALHNTARKTRGWRGAVIGAEAFALLLTFVLVAALAPWWAWLVIAAVLVPPLARKGRPEHKPIVQSAVTAPLVRRISTDAIVRAYERAGLCSADPKKPAEHLGFGSVMSRDPLDKGSQVVVYLPYGGTFAKAVNAKTVIASGLDVLESQVFFTRDKKSERRHTLRVLDTDPLAEPAGRTPLLDCK
jgi:DNA segregation ATPase FtsK/SpoIIIE, S-DNA-T family